MKTLETQFTESGWQFSQVERQGDLAIYRKQRIGGAAECYEVIRIGRHNGFKMPNKEGGQTDIPPAETYPTSNQWGALGWTMPDEQSARQRLAELQTEGLKAA